MDVNVISIIGDALETVKNAANQAVQGGQGVQSLQAGQELLNKDGQSFTQVLDQTLSDQRPAAQSAVFHLLANQNLTTEASAFQGGAFAGGRISGTVVGRALGLAQNGLPDIFKKQMGVGLMALGQTGLGTSTMASGSALMGASTPGQALQNLLDGLGSELSLLKLDQAALPHLRQILADSGVDEERISEMMASLTSGAMGLDQVYRELNKAMSGLSFKNGGLIASEDGLPSMGQFFMSLGLSPEVARSVTEYYQDGDNLTAASLRELVAGSGENLSAVGLGEAEVENLRGFLTSMGATGQDMQKLGDLLTETKGQLSLEGFLNFLEGLETAPSQSLNEAELGDIKALMNNLDREQELVRTPLFNEIVLKLSALGDRELGGDFQELSPALQALRGGISALKSDSESGFSGDGQPGGQHQAGREAKDRQRQFSPVINNQSEQIFSVAGGSSLAEEFRGYGGQETLARQISQKLLYSARRGLHRLKMDLNPETMGKLDIELKVQGQKLTARIHAENPETYQALAGEVESLKEALIAGGLELAEMTITYDHQDSGQREFADLGLRKPGRGKTAGQNREEEPGFWTPLSSEYEHQGQVDRLV